MKRTFIFLLAVFLITGLCACSSGKVTEYTVTKNGTDYVVNTEKGTIFDGTNTYRYSFSGNSTNYNMEIKYPDGSSWWWSQDDRSGMGAGYGGHSDNYDEDKYVSGYVLQEVLEEKAPKAPKQGKNILIIVLLFGIGIFCLAAPKAAWYLEYGWHYKDAEPSEASIVICRVSGAVLIVIGVIMIIA